MSHAEGGRCALFAKASVNPLTNGNLVHHLDQMRTWLAPHSLELAEQAPTQSDIASVCVDSRAAQQNALFFALQGSAPDRDGHHYLADAVQRGARILCVDRHFRGKVPKGVGVLRVDDTLIALQEMARGYLAHVGARVIAISGSIGKTSTTQLLGQIVRPHLNVALSQGNQNGQIGLPLSILNVLKAEDAWIILEMGIDRPGQLTRLIQIAPPEIALLTALEPVHMDHFATLRDLARAKGELFLSKHTRLGLLNGQMRYLEDFRARGNCRKVVFGGSRRTAAQFRGELFQGKFAITEGPKRWSAPLSTHLAPHQLSCLLGAISAARHMPLTPEQIAQSCATLFLPKGRFTHVPCQGITLIDDTYNASAASVMGALQSLPHPRKGGRRLAILAQMEELGPFAASAHRRVSTCAQRHLDGLICLEPMHIALFDAWRGASTPIWRASSFFDVLAILKDQLRSGDVLLLKGSRKWKLEELVAPIMQLTALWS